MVGGQLVSGFEAVEDPEAGLGAVGHGHRHRVIQLDHGRGLKAQQHAVKGRDLTPVCGRGIRRLGMQGGDRRLHGVGAGRAAAQRRLH